MESNNRKKKRSKVSPLHHEEDQSSFDLEVLSDQSKMKGDKLKFKDSVKELGLVDNFPDASLRTLTTVLQGAVKWKSYISCRRKQKDAIPIIEFEERKNRTGGIGLDDLDERFINGPDAMSKKRDARFMPTASTRALIQYFAKIGMSLVDGERVDLDFVDTLISNGANVNCTDKCGQTILHEVSRAWHPDIAIFLLEHGADVNSADNYGRTPLHVAAAVDYPEMIEALLKNGANKEARTKGEDQTPVHYAARNDACGSLNTLIKNGCEYKLITDYKGRTPIHVAAELDRSETARRLLELNAPVYVSDNRGQKAISWMITKMSPVAHEALNQYHRTDRATRQQYFYLNYLVADKAKDPECRTQSPVAVNFHQYEIVMHDCMKRSIDYMWQQFGKFGAWVSLILNFIYILLWTIQGVLIEYDVRYIYDLPSQWWRIVLAILALGFTAWQVVEEALEYYRSTKNHKAWVEYRIKDLEEDMKYCHPRWPDERHFLEYEMKELSKLTPKYFKDMWNIFDWICYTLLLASIVTHVVDVVYHSEGLARAHIRVLAVTIILLWLRLMKNARAFALLGPFIVIVSHMLKDVVRFLFLYLDFYIPYVCAFWMIFGGNKVAEKDIGKANRNETVVVSGYQDFNAVLFSLFRLTLVDDYDYDTMKSVDSFMTDLLVGTWLALSAILCLNLFIALLSDTFQRVYDNAHANAIMQKAQFILSVWDSMSKKRKYKFLDHIYSTCAPLKEYYDDDMTHIGDEDMKKVTIQIKEQLDELEEVWTHKFGPVETEGGYDMGMDDEKSKENKLKEGSALVTNSRFDREVTKLQISIEGLQSQQSEYLKTFKEEITTIKDLLLKLTAGGSDDSAEGSESEEESPRQPIRDVGRIESEPKKEKRKISKKKHIYTRRNLSQTHLLHRELLDPVDYATPLMIMPPQTPVSRPPPARPRSRPVVEVNYPYSASRVSTLPTQVINEGSESEI